MYHNSCKRGVFPPCREHQQESPEHCSPCTSNLVVGSQEVIKPIEHSELSHVKLTSVNSGFEMDVKHWRLLFFTCLYGCWALVWKSAKYTFRYQSTEVVKADSTRWFGVFRPLSWMQGDPTVCLGKQLITGTKIFPSEAQLMLSAHRLPLESWAVCLCNEVDGTALAYVCASQQCLCSEELRITVCRSWLCCCCSALNHCLTAVLACIRGWWRDRGNAAGC